MTNIESEGEFRFQKYYKEENFEYSFHTDKYDQKGIKDPLIFNPVKWIFNEENKIFLIKSKDNIKQQWRQYKDSHRTTKNLSHFLILERLFFHTPLGLEFNFLSNGPYLPFF